MIRAPAPDRLHGHERLGPVLAENGVFLGHCGHRLKIASGWGGAITPARGKLLLTFPFVTAIFDASKRPTVPAGPGSDVGRRPADRHLCPRRGGAAAHGARLRRSVGEGGQGAGSNTNSSFPCCFVQLVLLPGPWPPSPTLRRRRAPWAGAPPRRGHRWRSAGRAPHRERGLAGTVGRSLASNIAVTKGKVSNSLPRPGVIAPAPARGYFQAMAAMPKKNAILGQDWP